jgi:ABC-type nickel/cobalt efflux system permease component RcnA
VTSATLRFAPGAGAASAAPQTAPQDATSWVQARSDALTALISQKELPLGALLLGLVIAFGFGAAHALSPGHGKAIVAAYLVGSRGTAIHAAFLGLVVTVSHTIAVFLLGLIVLYASEYILPEKIYPWLGFASGAAVALVGGVLFFQRRRTWLRARFTSVGLAELAEHTHDHDHDHEHSHDHDHDHEHSHDHDHDHEHSHAPHEHAAPELHRHGPFGRPHSHVPAAGQAVTVRSMLALGITGGIIPCPSALVVLLAAIAYQKVGLGLLLILAFSLGLALVLTGIGLVMVYGRGLLDRVRLPVSGGLLARLPMASALAVACLGVLLAVQSLTSGGVLR